ncbi:hypothetical protein T492DRAFT_889388 [Pavlovales sp. CCMP2436]|nr:hypothetical protein T492DRAFT_889388 [Pavlovales sp. CCMP2436]
MPVSNLDFGYGTGKCSPAGSSAVVEPASLVGREATLRGVESSFLLAQSEGKRVFVLSSKMAKAGPKFTVRALDRPHPHFPWKEPALSAAILISRDKLTLEQDEEVNDYDDYPWMTEPGSFGDELLGLCQTASLRKLNTSTDAVVTHKLTPAIVALQHKDLVAAMLLPEVDDMDSDAGSSFDSDAVGRTDDGRVLDAFTPDSPASGAHSLSWALRTDVRTGRQPLHLAIINGYSEIVELLLAAASTATPRSRALLDATRLLHGDAGVRGALALADVRGRTPLCVAARPKAQLGARASLLALLADAGAAFSSGCWREHAACRSLMCEDEQCLMPCRHVPTQDEANQERARAREAVEECAQCGAAGARLKCGACERVSYCSSACQRTHWKEGKHKFNCAPTLKLATAAPTPSLRFAVGQRVECFAAGNTWAPGKILVVNYMEPHYTSPMPYGVLLDSGITVCTHRDDDAVIRKPRG